MNPTIAKDRVFPMTSRYAQSTGDTEEGVDDESEDDEEE